MQKLLIKGKKEISGSILAQKIKLSNITFVKDIFTMIELLKFIGMKIKIERKNKTIQINNNHKKINTLAPYRLVKTMRAGVLVLGPLLS